jgi:hypothetical protein
MDLLTIYAGDPKTNPAKASIVSGTNATFYSVVKVCGLQFKQSASMALSGFNSFSADVPAKVLYFSKTKVYVQKKVAGNVAKRTERKNSGTHVHQHDRFEWGHMRGTIWR